MNPKERALAELGTIEEKQELLVEEMGTDAIHDERYQKLEEERQSYIEFLAEWEAQ